MDYEAINLVKRYAVLNTGVTVPVTNCFGADGEETDVLEDIRAVVFGSDATGWWSVEIDGTMGVH